METGDEVSRPLPADTLPSDKPVFIVGAGPSLKGMDRTLLLSIPTTQLLTTNHSWHLFPQGMKVHFSGDLGWWSAAPHNGGLANGFEIKECWPKACLALCRLPMTKPYHDKNPFGAAMYRQTRVENSDRPAFDFGIEFSPDGLRGSNSGQLAINLAYHLGARRLILLGFDMKAPGHEERHFYKTGDYPEGTLANLSTYAQVYVPTTDSVKEPLAGVGVQVLNATPGSALTAFEKVSLEDVLNG